MKRTAILRRTPDTATLRVPVLRPKTCSTRKGGCGQAFTPSRPMQAACSPACAQAFAGHAKARQAAKEAAEDRKMTRAKLEAIKTIPQLKREAQTAFNAFIRARDRSSGHACICCGKPLDWESGRGGSVDAGHYRSTGSADHLRYHEDNAHAQLAQCNRYGAGRAVDYRIGLIARIGLEHVEALEACNTSSKWTRDGLREIRDRYRAEVARMKAKG